MLTVPLSIPVLLRRLYSYPSPQICSGWRISPIGYILSQITRIKEKVEEQSGVPPPQQRLIFSGRQLYVPPFISDMIYAQ
jgi:hypothetical protein